MSVNLLSPHHRLRRRQRMVARRWVLIAVGQGLLLALAAVALHAFSRIDDRSVRGEITRIQTASAAINDRKAATAAGLTRIQADLRLRDTVNAPPDYARLLALLASGLADEGMLTSLRWDLDPAPTSTATPVDADGKPLKLDPYAGPLRLQVQLTGLVRNQASITRVVERIGQAGLFDEVRLVKSGRDAFQGSDAFSFQLSCLVVGAPGGGPTP
mgnify:CR=1 FL=1